MPVISVIMPVFNTNPAYLKEAVNSILNQSFSDFELLIVNDSSYNQDTINCIDQLRDINDSRIRIFDLKNTKGISRARNYAIDKSRGKYIAFMDSDDISLSNRFKIQYDYLERNPNCGCLATMVKVIGNDSVNGGSFSYFDDTKKIELFLLFRGCPFCTSSVFLRKSLIKKYNLKFDESLSVAEDYDFWCHLIGKTQFAILNQILVFYRYHYQNISHRKKDEMKYLTLKIQADNLSKLTKYHITKQQCEKIYEGRFENFLELKKATVTIKNVIYELEKNYTKEQIVDLLKPKIRNIYYHNKGVRQQLFLSNYNHFLNEYFNLQFWWRLYCLVTRII